MSQNLKSRVQKGKLDYLEVAVAYLTHRGRKQQQVVELLAGHGIKVSQSTVSRLIEKAKKEHGILIDSAPDFIRAKVPRGMLKRLMAEFEGDKELTAKLERCARVFREVYVVQDADFIRGSAELLPNLLRDAEFLGISWGSTCMRLMAALSPAKKLPKLKACIPIQGDPAFWNNRMAADLSATRLAQLLEETLMKERRKEQHQYSLVGVPAYVAPAMKEGVERFYQTMPGYQEVFGETGVAGQLNGLITSVGVPSLTDAGRRGIFIRERIEQKAADLGELDKLCFGDFSGILLPKPGHARKVKELNAGWTGLNDVQIRAIAAKDSASHPGTILVAEGKYKAEAVLAAVRANFVTRLLIGSELAAALKELLKVRPSGSAGGF